MNTKNTIIASFLAVSAGFFNIAEAREAECEGPHAMMHGGMQDKGEFMASRVEHRLESLKKELKITPQQEPLWQAFADKTKAETGRGMQAMHEKMNDEKLSAPERMTQMQNIMKERLAAMESVHEFFKRLYEALTPQQQALADQHFRRMGRHERQGKADMAPAARG